MHDGSEIHLFIWETAESVSFEYSGIIRLVEYSIIYDKPSQFRYAINLDFQ